MARFRAHVGFGGQELVRGLHQPTNTYTGFCGEEGGTGLSGASHSLPAEMRQDASQCPAGNSLGCLQPLLLASRWHVLYAVEAVINYYVTSLETW